MRSLVRLCLLVAVAATGILVVLVLFGRPPPPAEPPAASPQPAAAAPSAAEESLRPYETAATLAEDLRDALAGPPEDLGAEVRRVSSRLATKARSVLLRAAAEEASPRVRALLVLAAGRHVQDEEILLAFLGDPAPVVRKAAALAVAHAEGGRPLPLLPGVDAPVGRALPAATRRALEARLAREEDEGVRGTLALITAEARNGGRDGDRR